MDDHPPNWGENGATALREYGLADNKVFRINPFVLNATRDSPPPIDTLTFAKGLVENYSLTHVELYRCGIDTDGMAALAQAMTVNKFIVYLGLARNKFFTPGGVMLCEALKVNQSLRTLDLSWNELRDEFAVSFAEMLHMNLSLQRAALDRNKIGDDGISALAAVLATCRKLRYLSLSNNKLRGASLSVLGDAMRTNRVLQTLDVSQNGAPAEGVFSLFNALRTPNTVLQTLNVAYNRVGSSIALLGPVLERGCTMLRELNLECTHLVPGAELTAFLTQLRAHQCITSVSFAGNERLGDAGVVALCDSLGALASLRYVDLSDCGATTVALSSVAAVVGPATRVSTLHLSGNAFAGAEGGKALGELLAAARHLEFLGASRCKLGNEGIELMCALLRRQRTSVAHFSLRSNGIDDGGFAHLVPVCLAHKQLAFLDLSLNALSSFARNRIFDILRANPHLPFVALGDKTLLTIDNCHTPWEEVHERSAPNAATPAPRFCDAPMDIPASFAPSTGFAVYSLAVGSAMKRQLEQARFATEGMLPYAGKPCRGASTWSGSAKAPSSRYQPKYTEPLYCETSAAAIAAHEANIGGLLVSDDQLRREFNRLDRSGNGYLDAEEFKMVYMSIENFGVEYTDQQLDRMFSKYCVDGNKLTFEGFCVLMLRLVNH